MAEASFVATFEAEVWESESAGAWAFVTVPGEVGEEIRLRSGPPAGFGSVRVEVAVGDTSWRTSVFPHRARGYVLPVKRSVRRAEGFGVGDVATFRLGLPG